MSIQPVYTVYTTCMCTEVFVLFKILRNCQSWEIFPLPLLLQNLMDSKHIHKEYHQLC